MKNNKPAKKAMKKAVAVKKVTPSKKAPAKKPVPPKPNPEVVKVTKEFDVFKRQALNEIESYKMTVGQLEAAIDDLKQKNAKLRKRLASYKEAKPTVVPAKSAFAVAAPALGNVSVPTAALPVAAAPIKPANQDAPTSPFFRTPTVPSVSLNKNHNGFSPAPSASSAFLKRARATKF